MAANPNRHVALEVAAMLVLATVGFIVLACAVFAIGH